MAIPIIMPRQGQTVESCIITKWHKKKGDQVNVGDCLFSYETDKAAFDEESKEKGILLDIFFDEGDEVPVLTNVCAIGKAGEDSSQFDPNIRQEAKNIETSEADTVVKAESGPIGSLHIDSENSMFEDLEKEPASISPRAKNLADRAGVDYRRAIPTGPEGRIIERDIRDLIHKGMAVLTPAAKEKYIASDSIFTEGTGLGGRITTEDLRSSQAVYYIQPVEPKEDVLAQAPGEFEQVKITNIRKVIAKTMHQSLANTAQLTLNASFDASNILEFRKQIKDNKDNLGLENITLNDIILYAVSRVLKNHRYLNAHYMEDSIYLYNNVHLGVAVDTPRGLIVPTLFNADEKSLNEISKESKILIEESKKGSINPDILKGATFTVTNLGSMGIESFTPILNPPQTGILGVDTITHKVKEKDGEYIFYPAMGLSLTFDHRAVDGAPAAKFLNDLKLSLENFNILLAK